MNGMRRQRALGCALIAVVGLILGCPGGGREPRLDRARVIAVRDGDTIELDDGRVVRYIGIDTPEVGEPGADSATALNRQLVDGKTVKLAYGYDRIDRYGRTLAVFYIDDLMVNEEIVRAGWAWCYFFDGNLTPAPTLLLALQEAMRERRGLWKTPHEETADYYVASFSAFRFHRPECPAVAGIKLHNRMVIPVKDSAFYAGFAPCANCRP